MSTLADAIASETKSNRPTCTVQLILARMTAKERTELATYLTGETPGSVIARGLTKIGHPIKAQTVTRHRSGECSCPRTV